VDLTEPDADQQLLDILKAERIARVVHLAFYSNPRREDGYAHELESIGTLALLAAAAAASLDRVVVRSFTAVYGARGQNPNYLTEESPLRAASGLPWARDKVEAEQHAQRFETLHPKTSFVRLRMAPLLGPGVRTFYTTLLDGPFVPVPLGYDPMVQLLHPEDALDALLRAVLLNEVPSGPLNIVPTSAIALRTALHLAEKIPVPVPHGVAALAADALWSAGVGPGPGGFVDFARFLFVADGARARKALGFSPRHSSRESLLEYLAHRGAGEPVEAPA
jgi:UDP-glucose 4-epimerase